MNTPIKPGGEVSAPIEKFVATKEDIEMWDRALLASTKLIAELPVPASKPEDDRVEEIRGRSDELDALGEIDPVMIPAYFNFAHEDRITLLEIVTSLSAQVKEVERERDSMVRSFTDAFNEVGDLREKLVTQKTTHAKIIRDEAEKWVAKDELRRLADKIEGGE